MTKAARRPDASPLLDAAERVAVAAVGTAAVLGERRLGEWEIAQFSALCGVVDNSNPVSSGGAAAAHPLMAAVVLGWSGPSVEDHCRDDGLAAAEILGLPLLGLEVLGAGQHVRIGRPVRAGERLRCTRTIAGVERKVGRSGHFLLITVRRQIEDERGGLVCECTEKFFVRAASS